MILGVKQKIMWCKVEDKCLSFKGKWVKILRGGLNSTFALYKMSDLKASERRNIGNKKYPLSIYPYLSSGRHSVIFLF
jgi:hypothetical protein